MMNSDGTPNTCDYCKKQSMIQMSEKDVDDILIKDGICPEKAVLAVDKAFKEAVKQIERLANENKNIRL